MAVEMKVGPLVVGLSEAQAYVRVEDGEEEALLAGLLRSAQSACEDFLGYALLERAFSEVAAASVAWQRLGTMPVRAIDEVSALYPDGGTQQIAPSRYAIDIDGDGVGRVRIVGLMDAQRVKVSGHAGMYSTSNDVPEAIRQGIIRLTAHYFAHRDGDGAAPSAVLALWRPHRRAKL
ncbi:head-tail connector protein [Sphingomicrobium arenosum]|uniref:head-tail connector protein n=1 Tax=Sphingomicrobium arenosum TaxID=2233861 RepID=UPI00223ED861|nr:hypothetical protein [Sphingomicrobium arenosum]